MKKKYAFLVLCIVAIMGLTLSGCEDISTGSGGENLKVHFIDVGQGDAIFIQKDGQNMLIDAGENQYGKVVCDYLKKNGVVKLDYVIGTHPHSDHIGGLDDVINTFDIGKVLLPKVSHSTKTFEDVLLAIQKKGLKITTPMAGDAYDLGEAKWTILGPNNATYDNLNDYSVVIKLEFENNSFLFTGDAEKSSEEEILKGNISPAAEVLKVGHHGSVSSTTDDFLGKVSPKVAIISLAKDNSYGHPHKEILERLEENKIKIYRTDIHGTIVAIGDGNTISFETTNPQKSQEKSPEQSLEEYIGNKNSQIFHTPDCNQLPQEKNRVYFENREQAIEEGYRPHSVCIP